MRNAPEEQLLDLAVIACWSELYSSANSLVMVNTCDFVERSNHCRGQEKGPTGGGLVLLSAVWIAIAVPAQIEQHRFVTHAR